MTSAEGERSGLLVERYRELERIGRCLQRGRQGHGGALVVEGPAGIGKTVLLAAGREAAEGQGFRVLRARGAELEREFAFGVVRQLVEPVVAGSSDEERAYLLDGPPGVAARLLGLPGLAADFAAGTPVVPDPSFAVLHGLYWFCANMASEHPLALVIDDAHWADGASLRFLAFLLPRLEELHIAVLLGARPAEAGESRELLAALTMDPATDVVTVGPLTMRGVATLVAAGLGVEPEPEFAAACLEATGGTPFLVRTLVEALREEHIAPVAASAPRLQNVATASLSRWAMLRLARLGSDAAQLARAVAVLEQTELDQAARLAELEPPHAASAADLLVRAGVLNEAPLCFTHPLLRGAVYRDMAITERAEAHRSAARLLAEAHAGPARVAEHLLATAPAGDHWTVEQLLVAAREAGLSGAPESAATYLRRAVAEPPSADAEGGMHLELGLAEYSAGQPGWHDHLEDALESAGDDATRIAVALLLASALRWYERLPEAVEVCDRVAVRIDGCDTDGHLVLEAMAVALGLLDAATAPSLTDRAHVLLERAQDHVPSSVLAAGAFVATMTNYPAQQVADLAHRAIEAGPRPLPNPNDAPWFPHAVTALLRAERYDEAQALLDAAVSESQSSANGMLLRTALAHRSSLAVRRGDLTAAEADARAVLDAPGPPAPRMLRNLATSVLVNVLVERGDLDGAERTLQPLASELQGTSLVVPILRHSRGLLRFAQHRFGEAFGDFQAAGEIATRTGAVSPCFLPWRSDAALAALALGEPDTARRLSDEELELALIFDAPRTLGVALRASGLVAGGQRSQALLREAIEVLTGPDTRLEQARTLTDLGALLRRNNDRVEARQLLRRAVDAAHRLGAEPLVRRAETELRATGAKQRRVLLSGLEALTASERRIAELAAEGLTNREIAQTLFVTARTVEGHLTNVFNKLDVKTRTELPAALASPTQAVRS